MKNIFLVSGFLLLAVLLQQCVKAPVYPDTPVIKFVSVSKTNLQSLKDSLVIKFSFTDGDGDLGSDKVVNTKLVEVRHHPDYELEDSNWRMPVIPAKGSLKQITGNIYLTIPIGYIVCLPFKNKDTMSYKITITDRAGHVSNTIETTDLYLNCN